MGGHGAMNHRHLRMTRHGWPWCHSGALHRLRATLSASSGFLTISSSTGPGANRPKTAFYDGQSVSPVGFNINFSGLLNLATEMGMEFPVMKMDIDGILYLREIELARCTF
uniref:Uncharacterized protein n=1 Tax=Oryza brachyantha TaxID=4533 RepID=J3KUM4_ORYBR